MRFVLPSALLGLILCLCFQVAEGADPPPGTQQKLNVDRSVRVQLNYLLSVPEDYDKQDSWPLLVFLHGSGERGDDLELVKKHGPPKLVEAGQQFPFLIVSPQCPKYQRWQPLALDALLDDVIQKYKVDRSRVYLTGLSMGGQGTWSWAAQSPTRFAALVPICGRGDRTCGELLADLPTWIFHGAKDTAVPVSESEKMIKALKEHGGEPQVTIYPEAAHDSWTLTYENPKLYEWLLKQRLEGAKGKEENRGS